MTKVDVYSGFLGAGKTTLIKKLLKEAYSGQKTVLIENEFGEIGIDGGFLAEAGVEITEINSGCICCSLTGDFREALKQVVERFSPDRILIEPSGVAKLSEIAAAVMSVKDVGLEINGLTAVVDAGKCKMYMKNFGEFFNDQISFASTVILSRTQKLDEQKTLEAFDMIRAANAKATIISSNWEELDGREILAAIDGRNALAETIEDIMREHEDGECDDPACSCHEYHHEHEHEPYHDHEHDHDHEHEHHHDHHGHHHGHDADEVFTSWGVETAKRYSEADIKATLKGFEDSSKYGFILRAKGIVECSDGAWLHFDYTPGEADIRKGGAAVSGMLCVIGHELNEAAVKESFKL